jgi:hypothetical protein
MYRRKPAQTKQLIALLLMAVLVLVHVMKGLHTHTPANSTNSCLQENVITKASAQHSSCSICEFQLARDTTFTGEIAFLVAPVHTAPTYTRLLTSINPDRLFVTEGRGPPLA